MRLLLLHRAGATSFEDLRTVDGAVCPTNREACKRLGLVQGDEEYDRAMEEAALAAWHDEAEMRDEALVGRARVRAECGLQCGRHRISSHI